LEMTRSLVLALALLLGALALTDRFVCPDGCTDDAPVPFDCVLCHGFTCAAVPVPVAPLTVPIARAYPLPLVMPLPPAPRSIEHPPRA
jgi:hypothetical protein